MKLDSAFLDVFQLLDASPKNKAGSPAPKKLSYLLRPAFTAPKGKTFVWGDWANIEARVLPWLAASEGAEKKLDVFRAIDKDPTLPDVYMTTAHDMTTPEQREGLLLQMLWDAYSDKKHPHFKLAKELRQSRGKVPELSLGFGGGIGALIAMGVTYGVYVDVPTATEVVRKWRELNQWAVDFWGKHGRNGSSGLWGAANSAIEQPDCAFEAGRVAFVYDRSYLGGTLFMALPDGIKLLAYPGVKWEWREVENKKTKKLEDRYQLTFRKGYGRSALWYGKLAENATQAVAALVLKRTLKRLDNADAFIGDGEDVFMPLADWMPTVMHTHDEVLTQCDEADADEAGVILQDEMERNDDWDAGLPLKAEIKASFYYTKAGD
jgi:DNA polymerase